MSIFLSLHASKELVPERDRIKQGVKPFRLTVVFEYLESEQPQHRNEDPKHFLEVYDTTEYFIDGAEIPYDELKEHMEKYFPDLDLDELTEKLIAQAIEDYYKS